jgi:1-acyl-sn-glycerol-3-phosphate acyltransferase
MHKIAKTFQALTYWPIYWTLKFFVHFKIEGQENLKGLEDKAIIFASNHASYVDGPICAASMPREGFYPKRFFPIRFSALDKYFRYRYLLVALYVWINGSIKIFRTGGDLRKSLMNAIDALNNNACVWIYPEGKLTRDDKLQPGKRGVAFLHQQTGAPIVPIGIIGNYGILSFRTLSRKNKLRVRIGKPIYSLGNASLEEGVNIVMQKIAELLAG